MTLIVTGIIGLATITTFLGFLVLWIKALPLTIIVVAVLLMLAYDLYSTVRYGEGGRG